MGWASYSRAVRVPSLEERTLSSTSVLVGNDGFDSEVLNAFEVGARGQISDRASADVALFYNRHDNLGTMVFDPINFNDVLFKRIRRDVLRRGDGPGPAADPELEAPFGLLVHPHRGDRPAERRPGPGRRLPPPATRSTSAPTWIWERNVELDGGVYLVDSYGPGFEIAEHVRSDVRLGWKPNDELEVFVGMQSWNESTYSEFGPVRQPEAKRHRRLHLDAERRLASGLRRRS